MSRADTQEAPVRRVIGIGFILVEDVVYIGLGVLLAASAVTLLTTGTLDFARSLTSGTIPASVVGLLDRILLVLLVVELLYTVQVSFREHALMPEPFLLVALIAAIRRVLVVTAEFPQLVEKGATAFGHAMIELGVLTGMIVALVASLVLLKKRQPTPAADRLS